MPRRQNGRLPFVEDFNAHFGATPKPSTWCIQSPSVWSLKRFEHSITDPDEFLRACLFKWSFNAKPDLVIHADHDHALCIEAKLESGESTYPAKTAEKTIFDERGLSRVTQTQLQKYLMEELLGITTEFLFLLPKINKHVTEHRMVTWVEVFGALNLEGQLPFVREWVKKSLD